MADPNINQYYTGKASRTEVDSGFPAIQPLTARDQLMALIDRESKQTQARTGGPFYGPRQAGPSGPRVPNRGMVTQSRGGGGEMQKEDPLAAIKAQDQYDMSRMNAARRPVGLGPQMIPGMAVDPTMLPPRLRPQQSNFQNVAGPSMAGLQEPQAQQQQRPSSNSGFDYMPAGEQARWLAAYGRG